MGHEFSTFNVATVHILPGAKPVNFECFPLTLEQANLFCVKAWQIDNKQYVTTAFASNYQEVSLYRANATRTTDLIAIEPGIIEEISSVSAIQHEEPMVLVDKSRPFGVFFEDSGVNYHVSGESFVYYFQNDIVTVGVQGAQGFSWGSFYK